MHFFRESIDGRITRNENVSTLNRQRQSPHERHLSWQKLLFPQDFTRTSTSTIFRYTSSIPLIQTFVFRVTFPTLLRRSLLSALFFSSSFFHILLLVRFLTIQFVVVRSFELVEEVLDDFRKGNFSINEDEVN